MAFELGGFDLKEIGMILLLVVFGVWLINKIPPVKSFVGV